MTDAKIDNNGVKSALFASNADGVTTLRLWVNPVSHALVIDDNTTGTPPAVSNAKRDRNNDPVIIGVSSTDGVTPTAPYIDSSTNKLLINST